MININKIPRNENTHNEAGHPYKAPFKQQMYVEHQNQVETEKKKANLKAKT
jgi:hypothetical protein